MKAKHPKLGGLPLVTISTPEVKKIAINQSIDFIFLGSQEIFELLTLSEIHESVWMILNEKIESICNQIDRKLPTFHNITGAIVDLIMKTVLIRRKKGLGSLTCILIAFSNMERVYNDKNVNLRKETKQNNNYNINKNIIPTDANVTKEINKLNFVIRNSLISKFVAYTNAFSNLTTNPSSFSKTTVEVNNMITTKADSNYLNQNSNSKTKSKLISSEYTEKNNKSNLNKLKAIRLQRKILNNNSNSPYGFMNINNYPEITETQDSNKDNKEYNIFNKDDDTHQTIHSMITKEINLSSKLVRDVCNSMTLESMNKVEVKNNVKNTGSNIYQNYVEKKNEIIKDARTHRMNNRGIQRYKMLSDLFNIIKKLK